MKTFFGGFFIATIIFATVSHAQPASAASLEDGFYKAKGKYYFVVNDHRARISKGSTFGTLLQVAQKGGATAISQDGYTALQTEDCVHQPALDPYQSTFVECLHKKAIGEELRERLAGKMVLEVENNGRLTYVSKNRRDGNLIAVSPETFRRTLFQYAKRDATKVTQQQILQLTKWGSVDSLR